MSKPLRSTKIDRKLSLLRQGSEKGLQYFYNQYFSYLCYRASKATQDACAGESIAQEAFFRLWLFREKIDNLDTVHTFLTKQVKSAVIHYYNNTRNRFHRSLLRLDGIEDYQEFMLGYELPEEEENEDLVYIEQLEAEKQEKMKKLNKLLPHLKEEQQLFIKLCLKYSFNYERIAYYLGGISDYEVSLRVEKAIEALKQVFSSAEKLEMMNKPVKIKVEGEFDDIHSEIFSMRYELQYSFDEISEALRLSGDKVRQLFVEAHIKLKDNKKQKLA